MVFAVLEPERCQRFQLLSSGDKFFDFLGVKDWAKRDAEVTGKPPEITKNTPVENFNDCLVAKNPLPDVFAQKLAVKLKRVNQESAINTIENGQLD